MGMTNVDTLRTCHDAFSRKDVTTASKLVAQGITLIDHGRGLRIGSRDEFIKWMEGFFAMASDVQLVDARYIDAGEYVTAQFRAVGTQDGPLAGFPASARRFSLDVCEIWRFVNGEAVEGHNYSDGLGLLVQLGHLAPPS